MPLSRKVGGEDVRSPLPAELGGEEASGCPPPTPPASGRGSFFFFLCVAGGEDFSLSPSPTKWGRVGEGASSFSRCCPPLNPLPTFVGRGGCEKSPPSRAGRGSSLHGMKKISPSPTKVGEDSLFSFLPRSAGGEFSFFSLPREAGKD